MCQNNQQPTTIVLAYDLDTRADDDVNTAIKDFLKNRGWQDTVQDPDHFFNGLELPYSTLIKDGTTIAKAKADLAGAIMAYNTNNEEMTRYKRAIICEINNCEVLPPQR